MNYNASKANTMKSKQINPYNQLKINENNKQIATDELKINNKQITNRQIATNELKINNKQITNRQIATNQLKINENNKQTNNYQVNNQTNNLTIRNQTNTISFNNRIQNNFSSNTNKAIINPLNNKTNCAQTTLCNNSQMNNGNISNRPAVSNLDTQKTSNFTRIVSNQPKSTAVRTNLKHNENKRPPKSPIKSPRCVSKKRIIVEGDASIRRSLEDIDWNVPIMDETYHQNTSSDHVNNKSLDNSEIENFKDRNSMLDFQWDDLVLSDIGFDDDDFSDKKKVSSQRSKKIDDFYGLPPNVKELLKSERNIDQLYEWQHNLMQKLISHEKNLVYCVPTSGGKTLVAELMILREIMLKKKNALFIFPYVSIVQEKIRSLIPFSLELDFIIEEYAGDKKRVEKNCLYIATIEKAHLLLTCLFEEKRLNEIGLVVVDELHMIGDGTTRGCTLESLMLLCMMAKRQKFFDARLIAMSATLNNFQEIGQFLDAVIEENNFRPVELIEFVKQSTSIFKFTGNREEEFLKLDRTLSPRKPNPADPDNLTGLVQESMPNSPLLIFSPTKQNCENIVKLLSTYLPQNLKQHKSAERNAMLRALYEVSSGVVCSVHQPA